MYVFANLELFERGIEAARSVTESWDKVWTDTLQGGSVGGTFLYGILCDIGVMFAVGTLMIMGLRLFRDLAESNYEGLTELIWPFLVALLLANNGAILSEGTLSLRNVINEMNDRVLEVTYAGSRLDDLYRQAQGIGNFQSTIQGYVQQCEALLGEKQVQCLDEAVRQSQELIDSYRSAFGPVRWLEDAASRLNDIRSAIAENPTSILDPTKNPIYWGIVGPAWQQVVTGLLWAWQVAFQTGVEVSLLLTALLGPLAVGGSLLPVGAKPIFAWLTGFFSIGILKLSFNIVAGLSAAMFTQASSTDPLFFPIFLGVFAPLLAGAIAAGGGLAVWSSITNAARTIVAAGTQLI